MPFFRYHNNQLYCESVPVTKLARELGTPFYAYSYNALIRQFDGFTRTFMGLPHLICFAMKANSNLAILRAIAQRGGGADIVTGGELFRCVTARVPPEKIVFSGVGKSAEEIAYALQVGILMFNVESAEELLAVDRVAKRLKKKAPVALRVNPDIDSKTHPYISTGLKKSKFGIRIADALKLYADAARYRNVRFQGISCHIGSQITQLNPFIQTVDRVTRLVERVRKLGVPLPFVDVGGGLGIVYKNEKAPDLQAYGRALKEKLRNLNATVIFEPGRVMMGNAGIFVTKVLYNKRQGKKQFVVVDGAMNDLMRPSLYGSYHEICPVKKRTGRRSRVDVVGPVCESGDFLAQQRLLPRSQAGDLLAVMSAGAYGFTMASNYNSRPRVAEVLVNKKDFHVIRERETYKDLPHGEYVPRFLV